MTSKTLKKITLKKIHTSYWPFDITYAKIFLHHHIRKDTYIRWISL